jgi:hypothetical protein
VRVGFLTWWFLDRALNLPLSAINSLPIPRNREAFKRAHYARRGLGGGYELAPVSVPFVWLNAPAYALLGHVADVAADGGGVSKAAFMVSALQELGVTLAKGNGHVLAFRYSDEHRPRAAAEEIQGTHSASNGAVQTA